VESWHCPLIWWCNGGILLDSRVGGIIRRLEGHDHPEGKTIFSETNAKDKSSLCFVAEKIGEHTSRLTLELYFPPHILRQVWFHRWGKKKKAHAFRLSLDLLDTVVKDIIVPLEF
jgi:hypothetical protein